MGTATDYSTKEDPVLLKQPEHSDRLTTLVEKRMPIFFMVSPFPSNCYRTDLSQSGQASNDMAHVSQQNIARFVTVLSIVLAVVLLFSAIVALYFVESPAKKLTIIGIYVVLFASSVGLLTTAKKAEIFAATAAYAAVLVVCVSGNLGSSSYSACGQA